MPELTSTVQAGALFGFGPFSTSAFASTVPSKPGWVPVDDGQTPNWNPVNDANTVVWVVVPT